MQGPGDLILLPPQWGHATINRRFTAGIGDLYCEQRQAEMLGGETCNLEKSLIAAGALSSTKSKLTSMLFANRVELSGDISVKNTARYRRHAGFGAGRPSADRPSRGSAPAIARAWIASSSVMPQVGLGRRGRGRGTGVGRGARGPAAEGAAAGRAAYYAHDQIFRPAAQPPRAPLRSESDT